MNNKAPWYWVRDTSGHGSVTVTLLFYSFWFTTMAYILSIVHKIGNIEIRQFDTAASSVYFGAICALYFARKHTDKKFDSGDSTK